MTTDNSILKEIHKLAEAALCDAGDALEHKGSDEAEYERECLKAAQDSFRVIREKTRVALAERRKLWAREAVLQGVVDNLCELQERQEEKEEPGQQGPWPDWGEAWEQAFAVRYGASQAGAALLEQLEAVEEREAVLVQELSFWGIQNELTE